MDPINHPGDRNQFTGHPGDIPPVDHHDLAGIGMRYDAAHIAYQSSVAALKEAMTGGRQASKLLKTEFAALQELTEAQAELLHAMARVGGQPPAQSQ